MAKMGKCLAESIIWLQGIWLSKRTNSTSDDKDGKMFVLMHTAWLCKNSCLPTSFSKHF